MSNVKNSQVIMKTDTSENWAKCEDKYIPAPYTIIVYQDSDDDVPRLKISDGVRKLSELPFIALANGSKVIGNKLVL